MVASLSLGVREPAVRDARDDLFVKDRSQKKIGKKKNEKRK